MDILTLIKKFFKKEKQVNKTRYCSECSHAYTRHYGNGLISRCHELNCTCKDWTYNQIKTT